MPLTLLEPQAKRTSTGEDILARLAPALLERLPSGVLSSIASRVHDVLDDRARQFDLFAPAPQISPAVSQLARAADVRPELRSDIAAVLSPSQVRGFFGCSARWWFKYGLKLPEARTPKQALGSAIHAAVAANFVEKLDSRTDLPTEGVVGLFRESWEREASGVEFSADDDRADMTDLGSVMVRKYMDEAAPFIQPAAVELPVEGEIAGVRVRGVVDLVEESGRIADLKTLAKSPNGIEAHRFQVATYTQLTPGASGEARLDALTKTRTVKYVPYTFRIDGQDLHQTSVLYPLAQEAMRAGIYVPNRDGNLCSRKNCPYWRECEAEYGGRVRGA